MKCYWKAFSTSSSGILSIIFCPSGLVLSSTRPYCSSSASPSFMSCLVQLSCRLSQIHLTSGCSSRGVRQSASVLRMKRQMAISITFCWCGRPFITTYFEMFIFPNTKFISPIYTTQRWAGTRQRVYYSFTSFSLSISYVCYGLSSNFCATPFRNSRQTRKSPFLSVYSLREAQRMSLSVKAISISVTLCTSANLSFMISPSCSALQGGKMTFSMSCILKQNLLEDFSSVSMVLEMPMRMSRSPFFWKSFMKSSVMGVGSALKSSSTSSMYTTQTWSQWASYNMLASLGAVHEMPPFS